MKQFPMFDNIEYTEDIEEMRKWIPLMMKGREDKGYMAASKIDEGTDVNYAELTRKMAQNLKTHQTLKCNTNMKLLILNVCLMVNGQLKLKI